MVNASLNSSSLLDHVHPEVAIAEQQPKYSKLLALTVKGTPIVTATAIACGCAYVGLNNPESKQLFPVCGFYSLTGFYCPGCGMTRAMHSVLHGNIVRAVQFNAMLVVALPVLIYLYVLWASWAFTGKKLPTFTVSKKLMWTLIAIAVVFIVGRNFPFPVAEFFARGRV